MEINSVSQRKQLLNSRFSHDIESYEGRGECYSPKLKAEARIILDILRKPNSIIVLLCRPIQKKNPTQMEHTNISCQLNSYNIFFLMLV